MVCISSRRIKINRNVLSDHTHLLDMVSMVTRDSNQWYQCDECEMLFDDESDAQTHEEHCKGDEKPSYLQ
ncbi:MAG: hypothetical protein J07HQW2_01413 [Haloquadratum walsbyi J07HQW2]|uniref:C2H2-type domain-containing protein n=1 Tax=Haloquadratum walsbyi J07HQW2 TaxID=1238425 RepID=U1PRK4_9EURY|nr:MAG: hypothetical protein J07HQW2_01413 [Haloquadratum walsbyi J07HQW2]